MPPSMERGAARSTNSWCYIVNFNVVGIGIGIDAATNLTAGSANTPNTGAGASGKTWSSR